MTVTWWMGVLSGHFFLSGRSLKVKNSGWINMKYGSKNRSILGFACKTLVKAVGF